MFYSLFYIFVEVKTVNPFERFDEMTLILFKSLTNTQILFKSLTNTQTLTPTLIDTRGQMRHSDTHNPSLSDAAVKQGVPVRRCYTNRKTSTQTGNRSRESLELCCNATTHCSTICHFISWIGSSPDKSLDSQTIPHFQTTKFSEEKKNHGIKSLFLGHLEGNRNTL